MQSVFPFCVGRIYAFDFFKAEEFSVFYYLLKYKAFAVSVVAVLGGADDMSIPLKERAGISCAPVFERDFSYLFIFAKRTVGFVYV